MWICVYGLTGQFVKADLDLERSVSLLLVNLKVLVSNERNLLIWGLGTHDVSEGNVLETLSLPDVIVIGTIYCQFQEAYGAP